MPRCKMSDCREPALPTGKRYCAHHKADYLRKQKIAESRPWCSGGCGGQTSRMDPRNIRVPLCGRCQDNREHNEAEAVEIRRGIEEAERERIAQARSCADRLAELDAVTDLEAMKDFVRKHLMGETR